MALRWTVVTRVGDEGSGAVCYVKGLGRTVNYCTIRSFGRVVQSVDRLDVEKGNYVQSEIVYIRFSVFIFFFGGERDLEGGENFWLRVLSLRPGIPVRSLVRVLRSWETQVRLFDRLDRKAGVVWTHERFACMLERRWYQ